MKIEDFSIIQDVCDRHGFTLRQLRHKVKRWTPQTDPRQIAREELVRELRRRGWTCAEVGDLINREKSTITYYETLRVERTTPTNENKRHNRAA